MAKYNKDEWEIVDESQDDEWEVVDESRPQPQEEEEFTLHSERPMIDKVAETAQDVGTAAHQAFTLGQSDEIASQVASLTEYLSSGDSDKAKIAKDNAKQEWRGRISEARERSPLAYNATEMVFPSAIDLATMGSSKGPSMLAKVARAVRSPITQGAIHSVGLSDEVSGMDAAIGAGFGSIGSLLGAGANKLLKKPRAIRQRRLGASPTEFKQRGRLSPLAVDKHLDELGFYKGSDKFEMEIDPNTMGLKKTNIAMTGETPIDNMIQNSDNLVTKYSDIVDGELDRLSFADKSTDIGLDDFLNEPEVSKVMDELHRFSLGNATVSDAVDKSISKVGDSFDTAGGTLVLSELNGLKKEMQSLADMALIEGTKPTPQSRVFAKLQGAVNKLVERKANEFGGTSGELIKNANQNMSRLLTQKKNLINRYSKEMGGTSGVPFLSKAAMAQKGIEEVGSTPIASKMREAVGFGLENRPKLVGGTGQMLKNLPQRFASSAGSEEGFSDTLGQINSIPKMLAKQPIPRDSKAILENKEFVKAKIAMAAPALLPYIEHALDEEPDKIEELLPMLVQMAPNMFEKDIYNRIDGKINDPIDRERALKDNREDDTLTNSQKAIRANRIALKRMV